jgi:hypothetical protein
MVVFFNQQKKIESNFYNYCVPENRKLCIFCVLRIL